MPTDFVAIAYATVSPHQLKGAVEQLLTPVNTYCLH
jgi:hypothetical protein